MQVEHEGHLEPLLHRCDVVLHCLELRKQLQVAQVEVTVEVLSQYSRSMVPQKHSVGVDHGDDEESVVSSQLREGQHPCDKGL